MTGLARIAALACDIGRAGEDGLRRGGCGHSGLVRMAFIIVGRARGHSVAEIAFYLGFNPKSVRAAVTRAARDRRAELREIVEAMEEELDGEAGNNNDK